MLEKIIKISLLIILIVFAFIDMNSVDSNQTDINNNQFETVARVTQFHFEGEYDEVYRYIYFHDGEKIRGWQSEQDGNQTSCIGKYYRLKLSTKHPKNSFILLNNEILDSTEINTFLESEKNHKTKINLFP